MGAIDLHAHLTPACLLDALARGVPLHGLDPAGVARGLLRPIDTAQRLADMDRLGVTMQVVSPEPQVYCYQHDAAAVAALHRECNDEIAALVAARPDRFRGLAVLPMQDVGRAVAELSRTVGELGLSGVMVGDHVNGGLYDEPQFREFWQEAERLGALVLLHQASPTLVAARTTRYHLANTIGNAVERTVDVAAIVFGGVLDAYPDVRICLCHGGGYTCFAAGRLDWGWRWRESARTRIAAPPSSYLSRFFYDCITHDERALRFIVDTVGIDRVVFGSDYPGYAAGAEGTGYDPVQWLAGSVLLSDAEKQAILTTNATALLRLPDSGDLVDHQRAPVLRSDVRGMSDAATSAQMVALASPAQVVDPVSADGLGGRASR